MILQVGIIAGALALPFIIVGVAYWNCRRYAKKYPPAPGDDWEWMCK